MRNHSAMPATCAVVGDRQQHVGGGLGAEQLRARAGAAPTTTSSVISSYSASSRISAAISGRSDGSAGRIGTADQPTDCRADLPERETVRSVWRSSAPSPERGLVPGVSRRAGRGRPGGGARRRRPTRPTAPTCASARGAGRARSCSRWRRGTASALRATSSAASEAKHLAIDDVALDARAGRGPASRPRSQTDRPGEGDLQLGVGQVVLDRLEAADRHAELLALATTYSTVIVDHAARPGRSAARPRPAAPRSKAVLAASQPASPLTTSSASAASKSTEKRRRAPSTDWLRGEAQRVAGHGVDAVVVLHDEQVGDVGVGARTAGRRAARWPRPRRRRCRAATARRRRPARSRRAAGRPPRWSRAAGPGRRPGRPRSSSGSRSSSSMPRPPWASGTVSPTTPISARAAHSSGRRPVVVGPRPAHGLGRALLGEQVGDGVAEQRADRR